jgi:hypothetical protein
VKPQDVVIIVFLYSKQVGAESDSPDWTFESIEGNLKLSKSAIHRSIENLKSGELMLNRRNNSPRLIEFLISGVAVLFPSQIYRETYGLETTVASPIFGKKIVSNKPMSFLKGQLITVAIALTIQNCLWLYLTTPP